MKSSVLFTLAGTVCCLAGIASAQVAPTSNAGRVKLAPAQPSVSAVAPAKSGGWSEDGAFVDNCGDAGPVGDGMYTFDLANATNDYAGVCGATASAADMWIKYHATGCGSVTATTCGFSGDDTVLSAVNGCGGATIACNDDNCGLQSTISFNVLAGQDYLIRIARFAGGTASGSVQVTTTPSECHQGPANDHCANATDASAGGAFDFDTTAADTDGGASCGGSSDVWYKYTAGHDMVLNVETCGLSGMDTELAAFDGCGGAELACNDDTCGLQSRIRVSVSAGSTTYVRLSGYGTNTGTGQVSFSEFIPCTPTRPDNATDELEACGSDSNGGCNSDGSTETATIGGAIWGTAWSQGGTRDTDWYDVTAESATEVTLTGTAAYPLQVLLLDANCPPAIVAFAITGGDCTSASCTSIVGAGAFRVWAGTAGFDGFPCDTAIDSHYSITISGNPITPPANDLCADATVVTDGTYDFDNSMAGNDGPATCGLGANDVWYSYTAASEGTLNATTCGLSGLDTVIAVYDGCGGAEIGCNDDSCGLQSSVNAPVAAGQTVLVRVMGFNGGRGSGQVQFQLLAPCNLVQPSGATLENEDCQSDVVTDHNGGCNDAEGEVQTVSYNTAIWGTASTFINPGDGGQYRDTDWYEVEFAGGTFHAEGTSEFNMVIFLLDAVCPPTIMAVGTNSGFCTTASFDMDVPAGTYRVFAGLNGFTGLDCGGAVDNHYILEIGEPITCIADFNGDGFLDFFDYDDYVGCFETGICPPGRTADVNGDNFVDFFDYDDFVTAFEAGC